MRTIIIILLSYLLISPLSGQEEWQKYQSIVSANSDNPNELARTITTNFDTDQEKVQAIYYWITHNIRYDVKLYKKMKKSKTDRKKYSKKELKEKELKEVKKTLKSKKGVCQQYSRVFEYLCEGVGIQSVFVGGYGKANPTKSGLGDKHAWNAVYLDGNWYLIDATFGAGYVDDNDKFHFAFNPGYFLADPDAFAMNHFPTQSKWQLSQQSIDKDDYKKNPGVGSGYFKYKLSSLTPGMHKLTAERGVPLVISFTAQESLTNLLIANIRQAKEITSEQINEGERYTITVNTDELKSGTYGIFEGQVLLFVYRISVN